MSGGGGGVSLLILAFSPPRSLVGAAGGSGGTRASSVASRPRPLSHPDLGRTLEILSFGLESFPCTGWDPFFGLVQCFLACAAVMPTGA